MMSITRQRIHIFIHMFSLRFNSAILVLFLHLITINSKSWQRYSKYTLKMQVEILKIYDKIKMTRQKTFEFNISFSILNVIYTDRK